MGMLSIDLNCDMGEGSGNDQAIMPFISSVNIACGYHAGDEEIMRLTVESALQHHVAIGAHPSYPDRDNFGRTNMELSPEAVYDIVLKQVRSLYDVAEKYDAVIHHVKPHGALYNSAAKDSKLSAAICRAVKDFDKNIIVYGLSGSELIKAANEAGLKSSQEVFADRTYREDGSLTPRTEANALIEDVNISAAQVLRMVKHGKVMTASGAEVSLVAETICIHGDGKYAAGFAREIRQLLVQNGIAIMAPLKWNADFL